MLPYHLFKATCVHSAAKKRVSNAPNANMDTIAPENVKSKIGKMQTTNKYAKSIIKTAKLVISKKNFEQTIRLFKFNTRHIIKKLNNFKNGLKINRVLRVCYYVRWLHFQKFNNALKAKDVNSI